MRFLSPQRGRRFRPYVHYVADEEHNRIQRFDYAQLLTKWGREGSGPGRSRLPGVTCDAKICMSWIGATTIKKFDGTVRSCAHGAIAENRRPAQLSLGVAVDKERRGVRRR